MELPDWLRGIVLLGHDGEEYRVVTVDAQGYLGAILKASAAVTIADNVTVDQEDSIRQMQGAEGETLHTVAVDAQGRIIMVAYGTTVVSGTATVTQDDSVRQVQGAEGENLHTLAVDAAGRIIMVAYGTTVVSGTATVTQDDSIRQMQGDGVGGLQTVVVDAAGRLIMVPRGNSGHYLGVDSDGFMTTVMKGTYGAALKTLATDDEGYLVAILKDNSDQWGKKISVGLAELAARLGSPMGWDRRGQIAKAVQFENGFGDCWGSTSGAGADVYLSPYFAHVGGYSCCLVSGTTVGKSAQVRFYGEYAPADRVGLEVGFSVSTQPDYIYFDLRVWDGSRVHRLYARLNNATDKLQILNSVPAYVDVCTFWRPDVPQLSYRVKFVADLSTQRWVRVLSRGVEYDVSAVATDGVASDATAYFEATVVAREDGATSHTIYVDSVIVTTNEP